MRSANQLFVQRKPGRRPGQQRIERPSAAKLPGQKRRTIIVIVIALAQMRTAARQRRVLQRKLRFPNTPRQRVQLLVEQQLRVLLQHVLPAFELLFGQSRVRIFLVLVFFALRSQRFRDSTVASPLRGRFDLDGLEMRRRDAANGPVLVLLVQLVDEQLRRRVAVAARVLALPARGRSVVLVPHRRRQSKFLYAIHALVVQSLATTPRLASVVGSTAVALVVVSSNGLP